MHWNGRADCDRHFRSRLLSSNIRGELEIRSPSVSASDNTGHAANSSAFRANHTTAVSATVVCATRTERLASYVICNH